MTNDIGFPFQGRIWYWKEASFGGGMSGTTFPISCYVQSVKVGTGDRNKPIRDIGSAQVVELMELAKEPTISIEYNPQVGDTLFADTVNRTSACTLPSFAFLIQANKSMPDSDKTSLYVVGAKPNTIKLAGGKGEPYTLTIDFLAKSVVTTTGHADTAPDPLAGKILTYNLAGSITKSSGHTAYVTNSIDITFNHNLTSYVDIGGDSPEYIVEGGMDITGSIDITLDGGGGVQMNEILNNTAFTLTLNMGTAGAPKVTLPGCEWDSGSLELNVSGEMMIDSIPFTAAPVSCVTDGTCISIVSTV
jgi:hypothetical protein